MSQLPRLHVWLLRYEVTQAGTLPPLPTTALHGALARALHEEACVAPARPSCRGCPAQPTCTYPTLFEPYHTALPRLRDLGVTTELPRPLVISPDEPFLPTGQSSVPVQSGEIVTFRLTAMDEVWQHWNFLRRALERAGRRGVGPRDARAHLRLIDVQPIPNSPPTADSVEVTLRFVTPLRVKHRGQISSEVDAQLLLEAILRRAHLLAQLNGKAWEPDDDVARLAASLESVADLRVVRLGRYSGRQERWMLWPGLVGTVRLRGAAVAALLPLLHFGSLAQIGKATTFGFGRYELEVAKKTSAQRKGIVAQVQAGG